MMCMYVRVCVFICVYVCLCNAADRLDVSSSVADGVASSNNVSSDMK